LRKTRNQTLVSSSTGGEGYGNNVFKRRRKRGSSSATFEYCDYNCGGVLTISHVITYSMSLGYIFKISRTTD